MPGYTCPALLWYHLALLPFRLRGCYPVSLNFPELFGYSIRMQYGGPQPRTLRFGLGSSLFARRYLGNRCFFLFLRVLRCFSSPRFPRMPMYSTCGTCTLLQVSFLIRKSADRRIFAPHRSLSQLVTSFFGSQCQGIHLMLLFA